MGLREKKLVWRKSISVVNFTNIFMLSFYAHRSRKCKKTDNLTVFFMLLGSTCIKTVCRTLMKLTPGVDFTNVLCTTFTRADPKSVKKAVKLSIFFTLSGSTYVKAVRRTLMKLISDFLQLQIFNYVFLSE